MASNKSRIEVNGGAKSEGTKLENFCVKKGNEHQGSRGGLSPLSPTSTVSQPHKPESTLRHLLTMVHSHQAHHPSDVDCSKNPQGHYMHAAVPWTCSMENTIALCSRHSRETFDTQVSSLLEPNGNSCKVARKYFQQTQTKRCVQRKQPEVHAGNHAPKCCNQKQIITKICR